MLKKDYPKHLKTPIERGEVKMTDNQAIDWIYDSMCGGRYNPKTAPFNYFKDERHIAGEIAIDAIKKLQTIQSDKLSAIVAFGEMLKRELNPHTGDSGLGFDYFDYFDYANMCSTIDAAIEHFKMGSEKVEEESNN